MGLKSLQRISIPRVDKKIYSSHVGNVSIISRFHPCCYAFHKSPSCYTIWEEACSSQIEYDIKQDFASHGSVAGI